MARVLIIGGGVAGPVAAMALQRAGIDAVVHEAYAPTSQEKVGSYLTVASNGIDALRVIGADTPDTRAGRGRGHRQVGHRAGTASGELHQLQGPRPGCPMEDLPVALSGPAASVIGWPNPPGDLALDPAHRIGGVVALVAARVVDAARPVRPVALRGRRQSLPHRPPTPYQPLASRLNRLPVRFRALSSLLSRVGVGLSGATMDREVAD
jgi:FAD binding domain